MDINFDDLRGRVVYTVQNDNRIRRHDMSSNPKELFDIGGHSFSDGFGGCWRYDAFGVLWGYNEADLMRTRYDSYRAAHESMLNVVRALASVNDELIPKVLKAYFNGFYGTMYGGTADKETVIHIDKLCPIGMDGSLWYVWGFPGPDCTVYKPQDYGKTWALTEEELKGKDNVIL